MTPLSLLFGAIQSTQQLSLALLNVTMGQVNFLEVERDFPSSGVHGGCESGGYRRLNMTAVPQMSTLKYGHISTYMNMYPPTPLCDRGATESLFL